MSSEIKSKFEPEFSLDASAVEKIKASAKYKEVESITLRLSNARVQEFSDADLFAALSSRTKQCRQAVAKARAANHEVFTVVAAFKADVLYKIEGSSNGQAGVTLPEELLEGLKVELGGKRVSEEAQTISGEDLVWGLKPDRIAVVRAPGAVNETLEKLPQLTGAETSVFTRQLGVLVSPDSDADLIKD